MDRPLSRIPTGDLLVAYGLASSALVAGQAVAVRTAALLERQAIRRELRRRGERTPET